MKQFISIQAKMRLSLFACILSASSFSAAQELLWSDEFRASSIPDSSVWSYDLGGGGWGNGELQEYTMDNLSVHDGNLYITIQREEDGTITSGRIRSDGKLEFLYGTVEAKIKVPDPSNGLWPCLWMLGASFADVGWPESGSFTIMQAGSASALALGEGKTSVGSAAYWEADGQAAYDSNELSTSFDVTADFHKYRLEWTPDSITTYIDDITIFTKDISSCSECDEFHEPFFFIMNVAAGGKYSQIYDSNEITAPLPAEFVVDYIRIYDNGFTELSGSATPPPSTVPTPTPAPTLIPTDLSTSVPTVQPTLSPTDSPTTFSSTSEPTLLPTSSPTISPTISPSSVPDQPTPEASLGPTSSPTIQPVNIPIQQFAAMGITMTLRNMEPLSPTVELKWEEATGNYLAAEIAEAMRPEPVESVNVSVALVTQDPPFVGSRALERVPVGALRRVQAEQNLTFDAVIMIQSEEVDENDVNSYITGAFDSDEKNAAYVGQLMTTGDAFDDAQVVAVAPAASVTRVQAPDNAAESSVTNIGLIVGMVAVAFVICLVAFFVLIRWRKRRRRPFLRLDGSTRKDPVSVIERGTMEDDSRNSKSRKTKTRPPSIRDESLYTDSLHNSQSGSHSGSHSGSQSTVDVEYDYEAAYKNVQASVADSQSGQSTNTVDMEYDYQVAFTNVQASVADSQSGPTTLSSKDDTTLLNEFQVDVPAGKVGLLLETSNAGNPVVHEVKASSPMVGQVQVGDRLLSVDGQDMSNVMATTVSRIIASKQHNPVRRFTFGRPQLK